MDRKHGRGTLSASRALEKEVTSLLGVATAPNFERALRGSAEMQRQADLVFKAVYATNFNRLASAKLEMEAYVRLQHMGVGGRPRRGAGAQELLGVEEKQENDGVVPTAPVRPSELERFAPPAPRMGEALIGLFCSHAFRDAVLGDLAEIFEARAAQDGARSARAWYWGQVVRSFGAFGWRWAQRLVQLQAVLKLIGF